MNFDFNDPSEINEFSIDRLEGDVCEIESLAEDFNLKGLRKDKNGQYFAEPESYNISDEVKPEYIRKGKVGSKSFEWNPYAIEKAPKADGPLAGSEWPAPYVEAFNQFLDELHSQESYTGELKQEVNYKSKKPLVGKNLAKTLDQKAKDAGRKFNKPGK